MKIVRFPGVEQAKIKPTNTNTNKLIVGPMNFTCVECGHHTEANFSGMIFRIIDFYCSECGSHYKVVNPAFGVTKNQK